MSGLTHFDERGAARMVDVSDKPATARRAVARGTVTMAPALIPRWREMNTVVQAETSSSRANPTA